MTVPPAFPSDSMPMKYAFVVVPPAEAGINISAVVCVAVKVPEASDVRRTFTNELVLHNWLRRVELTGEVLDPE